METRQLLSVGGSASSPSQISAQASLQITPMAATGSSALTPQQIQNAYGINQIPVSKGTAPTIAIVDAYNDPTIASDLAAFDKQFGLSAPPSFTVDNLGATSTNSGWAMETALDVEWAHAIDPQAKIVLVEAASSSLSDLFNAVNTARNIPGVNVVSMSWGASEFYGEWNYDGLFTTPAGHTGVTFVAASGDSGAWSGPTYPSVSPNVLAVGGTTLRLGSGNSYGSEAGWIGSTGGFSGLDNGFWYGESAPSYQVAAQQASGLSYGLRTTPDVSFNADPNSGVAVYDSASGGSGWYQVGGTSAAAPAWAGLVAIADQRLGSAGKGSLTTTQALNDLYSLPSSDFHDITSGFNGYFATTGYDLVTGLGTPKANLVVAGLLAANGVSGTSSVASSASAVATTSSSTGGSSHRFDMTTTSTVATSSSATNLAATATLSGSGQFLGVVPTQTSSTQVGASGSQAVQQTSAATSTASQAATTTSAVGQSIQSSSRSSDFGTDAPLESPRMTDNVQSSPTPVRAPEPTQEPALKQAPAPEQSPAPERSPAPAPVAPPRPISVPSLDEFDEALARVDVSLMDERVEVAVMTGSSDREGTPEDRPAFGLSAIVGAAAIAAGGYRITLRQSDRKRMPWGAARSAKARSN